MRVSMQPDLGDDQHGRCNHKTGVRGRPGQTALQVTPLPAVSTNALVGTVSCFIVVEHQSDLR
jgi:hypothetical protein